MLLHLQSYTIFLPAVWGMWQAPLPEVLPWLKQYGEFGIVGITLGFVVLFIRWLNESRQREKEVLAENRIREAALQTIIDQRDKDIIGSLKEQVLELIEANQALAKSWQVFTPLPGLIERQGEKIGKLQEAQGRNELVLMKLSDVIGSCQIFREKFIDSRGPTPR